MKVSYRTSTPAVVDLQASPIWGELLAAAEGYGITRVVVDDFPLDMAEEAAGVYVAGPKDPWIVINAATDDPAFTLAHELAHHHLHQGMDQALYWSDRTYERQIEEEADAWAWQLLKEIRR